MINQPSHTISIVNLSYHAITAKAQSRTKTISSKRCQSINDKHSAQTNFFCSSLVLRKGREAADLQSTKYQPQHGKKGRFMVKQQRSTLGRCVPWSGAIPKCWFLWHPHAFGVVGYHQLPGFAAQAPLSGGSWHLTSSYSTRRRIKHYWRATSQ